jgi:uncharacterized protein with WD repeat
MGLYTVDLANPDTCEVKLVNNDNYFNVTLSPCGRLLVATGRTEKIELYEAKTMRRLCTLPYRNVFHLKMSNE